MECVLMVEAFLSNSFQKTQPLILAYDFFRIFFLFGEKI